MQKRLLHSYPIILIAYFILLVPLNGMSRPLCDKAYINIRPYSENIELFTEINKSSNSILEKTRPAENIDELQNQIKSFLNEKNFQEINKINKKMDEYSRNFYQKIENLKDTTGKQLAPWLINNEYNLYNFAQVSEEVYRFRIPSYEIIKKVHDDGFLDEVITLNHEALVYYLDPHHDLELTVESKKIINENLLKRGYSIQEAKNAVYMYQKQRKLFQSAIEDVNSWHKIVPFNHPEKSIESIFIVLEKILQARINGKKVGFHCIAGKHRTGTIAMLIEIASLEKINQANLEKIYDNYFIHTWWARPASRYQYVAMMPFIIRSKSFQSFRSRWTNVPGTFGVK